ncbi:MAG: hypothetical protein JW720_04580 [Sedimentisphaerales bacterium]|nr:hypothetical protein [Sedimentisphaerales bacterium]
MSKAKISRQVAALLFLAGVAVFLGCATASSGTKANPRRVIDLNGTWQIAQGGMDSMPESFGHEVPVPGLVDMAEPAFEEVGFKSEKRQAFWYRRTFTVEGGIPATAILKINKAKYGTKVFLNGEVVGEHLPCFTPALLDVKKLLKGDGQENELVVRLGANRESVPEGRPAGWDFEKYKYIPGIYDNVELILCGRGHIANVQTVPDISAGKVKVVTEIQWPEKKGRATVNYEITEARTGNQVGGLKQSNAAFEPGRTTKLDVEIPIESCRLWSPEDPFLYELKVNSGGDEVRVRFGMRSFRFDPKTRRAVLNGKPYYMRGTNVCVYRFFEDDSRGDKPWRKEWVRRLHQKFKSMHWNSIRYCIGFPPEIWYEVADEEGFLIQDEFPIWLLDEAPEKPTTEKIIPEYTEWMRERWNHACVVIWDAQNESRTPDTGKALQAVRGLDLSNRPWENGWAEPQNPTDFVESHPYLFIRSWYSDNPFRLKEVAGMSGEPHLQEKQKALGVPVVINEYAWLWLTRDGNPTCLTDKVYKSLLGDDSTPAQRFRLYARYLAALTEFWRAHRQCAGVLHFCGLTYSRPGDKPRPEGGATSDHFIDLENLTFEPSFERYVRDAFSPVGIMVDFWNEEAVAGDERELKVFVINDLYEDWKGTVELRILRGRREEVARQSRPCTVEALGREVLSFKVKFPAETGRYRLAAQLLSQGERPIRSMRDFRIIANDQ